MCKSVKGSKSNTLPIKIQGGAENAQNLPTQKASEKEGAWLQKENEDCRRQKRSQEKTRKRQKETDLLRRYRLRLSNDKTADVLSSRRGHFPLGFDAMLDLRYAHYWAAHENAPYLGIMTGLSAGYMYTHQATMLDSKFQAGDINYHVTATDVDQTTHQVLLEVPVMFSMVTRGGFFLNVGPKLMLPVYNPVKQTLNYPNITAYLPELNGEPIKNEVVTGLVTADQCELKGRASNELKIGLAAGLELGYEFSLNNGHSIDLGIYASYGSYFYKTTGVPEGQIISVVAPNDNSVAQVTVNQISEAMTHKLGHFDAGIKFSYNFDFLKK